MGFWLDSLFFFSSFISLFPLELAGFVRSAFMLPLINIHNIQFAQSIFSVCSSGGWKEPGKEGKGGGGEKGAMGWSDTPRLSMPRIWAQKYHLCALLAFCAPVVERAAAIGGVYEQEHMHLIWNILHFLLIFPGHSRCAESSGKCAFEYSPACRIDNDKITTVIVKVHSANQRNNENV